VIVIIMGTTGAGKTTIGTLLAAQLNWQFADADTFHPPANIKKMSEGIPLNDADRAPWLEAMRKVILEWIATGKNAVLACSALKRAYRSELRPSPEVKIIYLKGTYALFTERIRHRHGHFAGEKILAGQFADLEEPEDAITVDAAKAPDEIVAEIRKQLALAEDSPPVAGAEP
jgi:gluconokinase